MNAAEEFPSITTRLVRQLQWGECDPAGIIYYPTYFRWFDDATWALFASVGWDVRRFQAEGIRFPAVSVTCNFETPIEQGDRCEIVSRIVRFGGKSFVVGHDVIRADGARMAGGAETRVWGRFVDGRGGSMKGEVIPDSVRELFRDRGRT